MDAPRFKVRNYLLPSPKKGISIAKSIDRKNILFKNSKQIQKCSPRRKGLPIPAHAIIYRHVSLLVSLAMGKS